MFMLRWVIAVFLFVLATFSTFQAQKPIQKAWRNAWGGCRAIGRWQDRLFRREC